MRKKLERKLVFLLITLFLINVMLFSCEDSNYSVGQKAESVAVKGPESINAYDSATFGTLYIKDATYAWTVSGGLTISGASNGYNIKVKALDNLDTIGTISVTVNGLNGSSKVKIKKLEDLDYTIITQYTNLSKNKTSEVLVLLPVGTSRDLTTATLSSIFVVGSSLSVFKTVTLADTLTDDFLKANKVSLAAAIALDSKSNMAFLTTLTAGDGTGDLTIKFDTLPIKTGVGLTATKIKSKSITLNVINVLTYPTIISSANLTNNFKNYSGSLSRSNNDAYSYNWGINKGFDYSFSKSFKINSSPATTETTPNQSIESSKFIKQGQDFCFAVNFGSYKDLPLVYLDKAKLEVTSYEKGVATVYDSLIFTSKNTNFGTNAIGGCSVFGSKAVPSDLDSVEVRVFSATDLKFNNSYFRYKIEGNTNLDSSDIKFSRTFYVKKNMKIDFNIVNNVASYHRGDSTKLVLFTSGSFTGNWYFFKFDYNTIDSFSHIGMNSDYNRQSYIFRYAIFNEDKVLKNTDYDSITSPSFVTSLIDFGARQIGSGYNTSSTTDVIISSVISDVSISYRGGFSTIFEGIFLSSPLTNPINPSSATWKIMNDTNKAFIMYYYVEDVYGNKSKVKSRLMTSNQ